MNVRKIPERKKRIQGGRDKVRDKVEKSKRMRKTHAYKGARQSHLTHTLILTRLWVKKEVTVHIINMRGKERRNLRVRGRETECKGESGGTECKGEGGKHSRCEDVCSKWVPKRKLSICKYKWCFSLWLFHNFRAFYVACQYYIYLLDIPMNACKMR